MDRLVFFLLFLVVVGQASTSCRGFQVGNVFRRRTTAAALQHHQLLLLLQSHSRRSSFTSTRLAAAATGSNGFGFGGSPPPERQKKKKDKKTSNKAASAAKISSATAGVANKPYVKSQTDDLIAQLQAKTAQSCLGRAVAAGLAAAASSSSSSQRTLDPFWEFIPALISSKFPSVKESELQRIAGFVRHAVSQAANGVENNRVPLQDVVPSDEEIFANPHRPTDEIHAYMPGLGPTQPFYDQAANKELELCRLLRDNFETIRQEYHALLLDSETSKDRFQSVTSMNYESGWKTMVLFYNGHRIPGFPYHLCPTTTRLLETVPLAGRIAGFNRQEPGTGIPLHSDGNNMWLTCQMGIVVPPDNTASITVGPETRYWQPGQCLLYDTTYRHETMNAHASQERVVLHVDFFNTLRMTPVEIKIMQYIYAMREEFMKAEGVAKVGAQIL